MGLIIKKDIFSTCRPLKSAGFVASAWKKYDGRTYPPAPIYLFHTPAIPIARLEYIKAKRWWKVVQFTFLWGGMAKKPKSGGKKCVKA